MNIKIHKADYVIIGAGIFGLYAAYLLTKKGAKVILLEKGVEAFSRASAINQARVHNGYHYPRSHETAGKSAYYYDRFVCDFHFAIRNSFKQIYAISKSDSKITAREFINFCNFVNIDLQEFPPNRYFKKGTVEAAFLAKECSFDFFKIRDYLLEKIKRNVFLIYDVRINTVEKGISSYSIRFNNNTSIETSFVINATYAGINDINEKFGQEQYKLKYELCEVAFCEVPNELRSIGITIMDGDYFSVMPFGTSKVHSFTSVKYTPRYILHESFLKDIKGKSINKQACNMHNLRGCEICAQNIKSAWAEMYELYNIYLKSHLALKYKYSQFEIKAILLNSEGDDSRPTIIKKHTTQPTFISVFSGKISTIYDLEKYL